ncbi:hypothetical protein AVEN_91351-1 [Araneus ventricosus]|uniref:HTH psq-type domain-containing protein n=1 Tax=Araneus ventricosus TaxID=182803 RepID=A0A4Y2SU29_ARAVE|nr:hypothetical protein AVEN_91351-1 [Araneus ventricosus]
MGIKSGSVSTVETRLSENPLTGTSFALFLVNKQYHFKVIFGGSYSCCRSADMPISYLFLSPSSFLSEIPFYCSPLPEIPFLSKTTCLSIVYFLSDSEALALPKCRTIIYAMEPTKGKRVLLTIEQKFQIVSRIEAGETLTNCQKNLVLEYQESGI